MKISYIFCSLFLFVGVSGADKRKSLNVIVSRSSWGAKHGKSRSTLNTPVPRVVVHHTVTAPCEGLTSCKTRLQSIQNYHMNNKGWSDIGYNFLMDNAGRVYEGRGWSAIGAHTINYNSVSIGIALIGNYNEIEPNDLQKTAIVDFIRHGVEKKYIQNDYILNGHRDFYGTECPGKKLYDFLKTLPKLHATFMKHAKLRKLSSKSALTLHMDSKGANLLPHRQMNTTSPCMVLPNDTHGDGKTTVTVMNSDMEEILMINSYSELGFRLNTKLFVVGPAVLFPKLVLQWNVGNSPNTITEESLSLFKALDPPVDILIVGLGNANTRPNPKIVKYCLANKINVEFLPTYQACSTFNFLNAEQRYVAAALIPPTIITFKTAGILAMERRKLLEGTSMGLEETESLIKR